MKKLEWQHSGKVFFWISISISALTLILFVTSIVINPKGFYKSTPMIIIGLSCTFALIYLGFRIKETWDMRIKKDVQEVYHSILNLVQKLYEKIDVKIKKRGSMNIYNLFVLEKNLKVEIKEFDNYTYITIKLIRISMNNKIELKNLKKEIIKIFDVDK